MNAAKAVWKYGDPSAVPDDVKYAVGTTLGAMVWHPSVKALILDVARSVRRMDANERRRAARLHNRSHPQISSASEEGSTSTAQEKP